MFDDPVSRLILPAFDVICVLDNTMPNVSTLSLTNKTLNYTSLRTFGIMFLQQLQIGDEFVRKFFRQMYSNDTIKPPAHDQALWHVKKSRADPVLLRLWIKITRGEDQCDFERGFIIRDSVTKSP